MKKRTYLGIAAVITAFLLLAALAAYLTISFGDSIFTNGEAGSAPESDFHFETEAKTAETAAAQDTDANHFLIWVGDSRTVGMRDAVNDGCLYIGAAGEGYDWFAESGESQMRSAIAEHPDAPVILNLGVNDYDNMDLYLKRYRSLAAELPDTVFYYLSVNPIDPSVCTNITNEQISDFNSHLKEAFPDTYIDSYTYLMISEISPFDGVHYTEEAYQMLHDYVLEQITGIK